MSRFFLIFIFFLTNFTFSFVSKFINLPPESLEYNILKEPEKYPLRLSALVACGVKNEKEYISIIDNFEKKLTEVSGKIDKLNFAKLIFNEMHINFLKNYGLYNDHLDVLLKRGNFNCLSSTILYSIFLEDFNYEFKAIALPTHIFTLLIIEGNEIDVENTTPNGFDIRTNLEAQKVFKKLTGFDYTRETNKIEIIDKRGLLASLYANLSASDMRNKNFYSGFQNAIKAYSIAPNLRLVASNTIAAYQSYITYLKEEKNFTKALDVAYEALNFLPEKSLFTNMFWNVLDSYLSFCIKFSNENVAINVLREETKRINIPLQIKENLYINIYNKEASQKIDFDKLYSIFKDGFKEMKDSQKFRELVVNAFYLLTEKSGIDDEKQVLSWYKLMQNNNDMKKLLINFYIRNAHVFYKKKEIEKAIKVINRGKKHIVSSELDNILVDFYILKAIDEIEKGNYEAGKDLFIIAKRMRPGNAQILKNLRLVYRLRVYDMIKKENFETAEKYLNEGLKEFPDDEKLLEYKKYIEGKKK